MIEAGQDFLTVKEVVNEDDGKPDLLVTMDYDKVVTVGKLAVGKLLEKLQIYKASQGNGKVWLQIEQRSFYGLSTL